MSIASSLGGHAQSALATLGTLWRQPFATLLTVLVIGIALALPTGLQVLVQGAQALAGTWQEARDFSVYLKPGAALDQAEQLATELRRRPGIESARVIPADRALADFRDDPAFADVLQALKSNPLPHAVVVRPSAETDPSAFEALRQDIVRRPDVDLVQMDTGWLARLHAILGFVRRAVVLLGALLTAAALAIVGNTIRLDIQQRRQEIEVAKLLGATDGFVRRPFLYLGFWYGALGAILALVIVGGGLLALSDPLARVAALYQASIGGFGLRPALVLGVLGGGLLAGWGGAWLAVARHLTEIQPKV
jgi:cell division transport system permease protein